MKNHLPLIPLLLLSSITFSCAAMRGPDTRIDDALLSELSVDDMARVVDARVEADAARDALAKAERDTKWAEEQVDLTRSSLTTSRASLDEAKLSVVVAERSGTVSQHAAAEASFTYAAARSDCARELLALKKRELERAKLAQKLAREQHRLANAVVQLEKAEAVAQLDRVAARKVPVKDYRKQVRYHETEVDLARVRLEGYEVELEEAQDDYETARMKADELMPRS